MAPSQTSSPPTGLDKLPSNIVIAIEICCAVVLLALFGLLIFLFCRVVTKYRRILTDLEARGVHINRPNISKVPSSSGKWKWVLRRDTFTPTSIGDGWSSLKSLNSRSNDESVMSMSGALPPKQQSPVNRDGGAGSELPFVKLPGGYRCFPLNHLGTERLSAIIESPNSKQNLSSPELPLSGGTFDSNEHSAMQIAQLPSPVQPSQHANIAVKALLQDNNDRSGATASLFKLDDGQRDISESTQNQLRSKSIACFTARPKTTLGTFGMPEHVRPPIHQRSLSLCSPRRAPISQPIIQLSGRSRASKIPVVRFSIDGASSGRSIASLDSGSSVMFMNGTSTSEQPNARLKRGANHEWEASLIVKARPVRDSHGVGMSGFHRSGASQTSIQSNTARYSTDSTISIDLSRANSVDSYLRPESSSQGSISVQPTTSILHSQLPVEAPHGSAVKIQELRTPRHHHRRPTVNMTGSPVERKSSARRDCTSNKSFSVPARQHSQASSTRSSNGNPFQFETSPMLSTKQSRPQLSALKGSPNARKGHKRQSFVRLALQPTYLGPPEEEERSPNTSPLAQHPVRSSVCSSNFSIPRFPSPCRTKRAEMGPPPTFIFSRPSGEFDEDDEVAHSSPFELLTQPITPAQLGIAGADRASRLDLSDNANDAEESTSGMDDCLITLEDMSYSPPHSPAIPATEEDRQPPNPVDAIMNRYVEESLSHLPGKTSPDLSPSKIMIPPPLIIPHNAQTSVKTDNEDRSTSQKVQGPRIEPPKPVRESVMKLRRMNSDVKPTFRADRRYLRLGREASPTLLGEASTHSLVSWGTIDLTGQSSGNNEKRNRGSSSSVATQSPLAEQWSRPTSLLDADVGAQQQDIDLSDGGNTQAASKRGSGILAGSENTWDVTRHATAEEEKENVDATVRPQLARRSHMRKSAILNATMLASTGKTASEMSKNAREDSERATLVDSNRSPESLYDRDGFLR